MFWNVIPVELIKHVRNVEREQYQTGNISEDMARNIAPFEPYVELEKHLRNRIISKCIKMVKRTRRLLFVDLKTCFSTSTHVGNQMVKTVSPSILSQNHDCAI